MGEELDVSDEALWRQVVSGDGDAFGELFDRHYDRVWRHALNVLRMPHVAEDVVAVVFYEAWRRRANIRIVNDSILPWLLITTNNTLRNHVRQQRRYRHFLNQLPPPGDSADIAESIADADESQLQASASGKRSRSSERRNATFSPCALWKAWEQRRREPHWVSPTEQ